MKEELYSLKIGKNNMPEIAEVRISAESIKPLVQGKSILSIATAPSSKYATIDPDGFKEFSNSLLGENPVYILNVSTKGKLMYWTFSNEFYMTCGFGMSGQWSENKDKHPCLLVKYKDNDNEKFIYFNDPRHFGNIAFLNGYQKLLNKINSLGWDPFQNSIDEWSSFLNKKIQSSKKSIAQLLMDQSLFAGVGNYIKCEALYRAKISPWRLGRELSQDELKCLYEAVISVANESYNHQGATILTYKDSYGAEGKYSNCFKVYGKTIDPLGNQIIKENTLDKRTTHWCPVIQR